jgi:hypothetical protein
VLVWANPEQLRLLSQWLAEHQVEEVVMESTALYWKPVWGALERYWQPICQKREGAGPTSGILHLAQAQSNRGPRGRKKDFRDAERLVKRLVACNNSSSVSRCGSELSIQITASKLDGPIALSSTMFATENGMVSPRFEASERARWTALQLTSQPMTSKPFVASPSD